MTTAVIVTTYPKLIEENATEETLVNITTIVKQLSRGTISKSTAKEIIREAEEYADTLFMSTTPPKTLMCAVAICVACEDIAQNIDWDDPNTIFLDKLYEKMLRTDSARMQYKLADKAFAKKIKMYPDSVRIMGEYLILIALKDGKEIAYKKYDEFASKLADSKKLSPYKQMLNDFDHSEFVNFTVGRTERK